MTQSEIEDAYNKKLITKSRCEYLILVVSVQNSTLKVKEVCAKFFISERTYYRLKKISLN